MKLAAVQYKAKKGDLTASRSALAALAAQAEGELVVLPEMAVSGYLFHSLEEAQAVAEAPDGPTFQALQPVAKQGRWVVCGFAERANERVFNSAMVLNPAGELAFVYRKTYLYEADLPWASAGDSGYASFDTEGFRFTLGICMDINDDRFIDHLRQAQAEVVAFPTNWVAQTATKPLSEIGVWDYWAWRMHPVSSLTLVAADTWGMEEDVRFAGLSAVLHNRRVIAHAPESGDGWLNATLPAARGAAPGR